MGHRLKCRLIAFCVVFWHGKKPLALVITTLKCETTEKGHGRIEHRKYYLTTNLDWLSGKEEWGNLFGFGKGAHFF